MQILLLQENIEVREKVTFLLESNFGATVTGVGTVTEATACVTKRDRTFDLIIWESKTGVPPESDSFRVITIKIPTIVSVVGPIDEAAKTGNLVGIIDRKGFAEGIVALIQGLVQKRVLRSGDTDQEQVRIRTKLLLSVCPLKGDIYIRLSQNKYVKLFREGDVFDLADLEK